MAWDGSITVIFTAAAVTDTEQYSDYTSLNPGELSHVRVKAVFTTGTPTDDLEIRIYGTIDASSENSDTEALITTVIEATASATKYRSIPVSGLYKYRVGVAASGSTDTITTTVDQRSDGVDV